MVSSTIEYALRALAALAERPAGQLQQGHELAEDCDIPANYMSKILWTLGKAGIVEAVRGVGGGYRLARPARDIRLKAVFTALDGGDCQPHCLVNRQVACRDERPCSAHHAWRAVHRAYLDFLETMTLADIANHPSRTLYVRKPRSRPSGKGRSPASAAVLLLLLSAGAMMAADTGEALFTQACAACHSIGQGRRLGPDLRGVEERRQRDWLIRFIVDPKKVLDSGDVDAQAMLKEYGNVVMPGTGMDEVKSAAILDYIRSASATTAEVQAPGDPARGLSLFTGRVAMGKHGASCVSCHAVAGLPVPGGGGSLGPDLTAIGSRLGGEVGLAAWLASPPTPVMRDLFAAHPLQGGEARDLAAWLATSEGTHASFKQFIERFSRAGMFFVVAFAIAAAVMAVFNLIWHRRVDSVRASLTPIRPDGITRSNRS